MLVIPKRGRAALTLVGAACVVVALSGCRQVLGIEELTPGVGGSSAQGTGGAGAQSAGGTSACAYRDLVIADQPVAYWRLGEMEGSTAADEMGMVQGTYMNDVVLGVEGAIPCADSAI